MWLLHIVTAKLCDWFRVWQLHSVTHKQSDKYTVWLLHSVTATQCDSYTFAQTANSRRGEKLTRWKKGVQNSKLLNILGKLSCIKMRRVIKSLNLYKEFLVYVTRQSIIGSVFCSAYYLILRFLPFIHMSILFNNFQQNRRKISVCESALRTWKTLALKCNFACLCVASFSSFYCIYSVRETQ